MMNEARRDELLDMLTGVLIGLKDGIALIEHVGEQAPELQEAYSIVESFMKERL